MKIDVTTIFFNSNIDGGTATAPWCVSIGQGKDKKINNDIPGLTDVLDGLIYKSVSNRDWVDTSAGSKNNEYLLISKFDKIFINGVQQASLNLIALLVREHTKSHEGRLRISFPPYASYNDGAIEFTNQHTYQAISDILGCGKIDGSGGCWFVDDISVLNQDELHLSCIVVDPDGPKIYKTSQNRSGEWQSLSSDRPDYEINRIPDVLEEHLKDDPLQQIFYGAPGTGKSHTINQMCSTYENYRTTFHPDTDYASFVGSYKPITVKTDVRDMAGHIVYENGKAVKGSRIVYRYVMQSFLKAYVAAWREQQNDEPKPVFLIVEEINRGNCAQIFGDIFQLLDRNTAGFSDYPIVADDDLAQELKEILGEFRIAKHDAINALYPGGKDVVGMVKNGECLLLPNNMYIWSTMNTSDQSLFPIDSAFKRRWDWNYIKIKDAGENFKIVFSNGNTYNWWDFVSAINKRIEGGEIQQEDKKLGYFFAKAKDKVITPKVLLTKVLFYLYNDVFKDFGLDEDFLKDEEGETMSFASYFNEVGDADEDRIERFVSNLGITPIHSTSSDSDSNFDLNVNGKKMGTITDAVYEILSSGANTNSFPEIRETVTDIFPNREDVIKPIDNPDTYEKENRWFKTPILANDGTPFVVSNQWHKNEIQRVQELAERLSVPFNSPIVKDDEEDNIPAGAINPKLSVTFLKNGKTYNTGTQRSIYINSLIEIGLDKVAEAFDKKNYTLPRVTKTPLVMTDSARSYVKADDEWYVLCGPDTYPYYPALDYLNSELDLDLKIEHK